MTDNRRLLVVDDDPFTRSVLGPALTTRGWDVILCAAVKEAIAVVDCSPVDLAVIDFDLGPGPDGLDLALALRRRLPMLPIVMLTSYRSPQLRDVGHGDLPMGVRYLVKGAVSSLDDIDRELRTAVLHPFDVTVPALPRIRTPRGRRLSDRQLDVMRLIATGYGNAEIASELRMAEPAVEKAITRLIRQLGLHQVPQRNKRVLVAAEYFRLSRQPGAHDV